MYVAGGQLLVLFVLGLTLAMIALCVVLVRRQAGIRAAQELRSQLVSEAMQSDERRNREIAERLHDGPLQTLLAVRLQLDEIRERIPDAELDAVYMALQDTATALRSAVTELHPQVLAQLGLTPALRELLSQFESRCSVVVEATLEEVGKPASQQLLYRAARELMADAVERAQVVTVQLARVADRVVLTIADDGAGIDAAGHLGLLQMRFEAMGGSLTVDADPGRGTRVTAAGACEDRQGVGGK